MIFGLQCPVQLYDWGKLGAASTVAQFAQSGDPAFVLQPEKPYAELWMGTHPKGPAKIIGTNADGQTLGDWLKAHPEALGSRVAAKYGGELPFLFKILSVNKALSIQAHPDKALAEQLFAADPANYPDANHKPEIAIALTPFQGMCGFRPVSEIAAFVAAVPELAAAVGPAAAAALAAHPDAAALKLAFRALMECSAAVMAEQLRALVGRLGAAAARTALDDVVLRTYAQYPDDGGVFCLYFLNVVTLQPGEALFLGPNDPHAYLAGDCVECMACSDNVVRAGLTPKFKDVSRLCDMLTYVAGPAAERILHGVPQSDGSVAYPVPVNDFAVSATAVAGAAEGLLAAVDGASIVIVTAGSGSARGAGAALELAPGRVFFVAAGTAVSLHGDGLAVMRAFCVQ